MKEKISNWMKENWFCYLIIAFFSCLICIPLLNQSVDLWQDDGVQHICRLMGTMQSLTEHNFFPVIMSNFCNGFGYSWNLFYSVLTAYVPLVFRLFGASYLNCIKLFCYLITLASGLTMFTFTKKVTKNQNIALLASIFYVLLPYRITDMYMRVAIAELASFVFLPMVFYGIYTILEEGKRKGKKPMSLTLTIGTVGLLLTHTVITFYTAIFAFLYLLVEHKKWTKKGWIQIGISLLLILLLTAFFLVPLLEHYLLVDYEVFQKGRMSRVDVLEGFKLEFVQLFKTEARKLCF